MDDWSRPGALDGVQGTAILVLPSLHPDGEELVARLGHSRAAPLILVTGSDPSNLVRLVSLSVDAVVLEADLLDGLPRAIRDLEDRRTVAALIHGLERRTELDPIVRAAIRKALRSIPPIRSVSGLAAAVGCDRRTLWVHWRNASEGGSPTAGRLLRLVLVLRALESRAECGTWREVAARVGLPVRRLRETVKSLTGRRPRELAGAEMRDAARSLIERADVLIRSMGRPESDGSSRIHPLMDGSDLKSSLPIGQAVRDAS